MQQEEKLYWCSWVRPWDKCWSCPRYQGDSGDRSCLCGHWRSRLAQQLCRDVLTCLRIPSTNSAPLLSSHLKDANAPKSFSSHCQVHLSSLPSDLFYSWSCGTSTESPTFLPWYLSMPPPGRWFVGTASWSSEMTQKVRLESSLPEKCGHMAACLFLIAFGGEKETNNCCHT